MRTRYLLIASAALAVTATANAEPAKPEPRAPAAQSGNRPVVLASADQVQAPTPAVQGQNATPAKRPRAARVTTCRCGDQTASER